VKFLILFLLPFSASAGNELGNGRTAGSGNELGNGGDYVAQQFIAGGRELVTRLREHPDSRIPDVNALEKAVERVKVTSAGSLSLHGAEVDAINFPSDDHIDVNRARWQESAADKRVALVLHEYLGILQVNDLHYEVSGSYAEAFHVPDEKPKRFSLEAGTTINTAIPDNYRWYKHPGVEVMLAYALTQRSSLTLRYARQSYSEEEQYYSDASSLTTVAAGYKIWMNDSRKLRPFVEGHAGYAQPTYDGNYVAGTTSYGEPMYTRWNSKSGSLLLGTGGGVRYALSKDFGVTGSGYLQEFGLFSRSGLNLALQFNLGIDVLL
jgi:hypothetical protein